MPGTYSQESLETHFTTLSNRLGLIESQLALLSAKAGVPYAPPSAGVPPEVVELARSGKTFEAIRRYREMTGAGVEEAQAAVLGV